MGREIGTLIILHFEVHVLCIYEDAPKLSSIIKNERKSKHFTQTSCFIFLFYYIPQESDLKFITKPFLASENNLLFHIETYFSREKCIFYILC